MSRTSVCFVVTELLGTAPFGGIATATSHGALVLAQAGYDVELLHCGHDPSVEPEWEERYRDAGVLLRRLDRRRPVGPDFVADSYRTYEQLVRDPADVIVFQDWLGLGFCSMQAKRAGEFERARLVHIVHGPSDWLREANRRQLVDAGDVAVAWMERRSAELADAVVGPSAYLLDWMAAQGWSLPVDRHVIPYFTEGDVESLDRPTAAEVLPRELTELVFFGRLEERKGVRVLAGALNRLGASALRGLTVTFLGRAAPLSTDDVLAMIEPSVRAAVRLRFEGGLDQARARAYLRGDGRVALMPSLLDNSPNVIYECIEDGIPFLASGTGGNAELVHPDDRASVLFEPTAPSLADAIERLLAAGVTPRAARPAFDGRTSLAAWRRILAPASPPRPAMSPSDVDVAVVITHHDQGRYLADAVASAVGQTHERLEVVVVDDGSTDPSSLEALDDVEAKDWGRPVRVVRQDNRYLGAARNVGIRSTDARYVAFCDDDDILEPDYVETLLTTARRSGAAAVATALRNRAVDDAGDFRDDVDDPVWVFLDGNLDVGIVWNTFGGAGMLVDRQVLLDAGGFHEHHGIGHEDWDLLLRLALAGHDVLAVPRPLYQYRILPTSMVRVTSQFANMVPLFASYAAGLPPTLQRWPVLVRGLHLHLDEARHELGDLRAENDRLLVELERRTRYIELLRTTSPERP